MAALLSALYLIYNEGHTASSGNALQRIDLTAEAMRLTRLVFGQQPEDGEVAGLLALMLLTDARRPARTDSAGNLIPLDEQDRELWDSAEIAEGVALITAALAGTAVGPYQLQAAIAAVHDEATAAQDTDWPEILALYDLLRVLAPGPMVELSRAVAITMVEGPAVGLARLDELEHDPALAASHRPDAIRAHLLELGGDSAAAAEFYARAARRTLSVPERRYLEKRAAACRSQPG
jgi:predicted RNA polymerase sigma factor